ncbi:MAG: cell division protein FtsX [Nitrospirota bacterium]
MRAGNRGTAAWVIVTSAVVLTLAGGCWLVAWNAWLVMRGWRADVKVVVYLTDTVSEPEVAALQTAITREPAVASTRIISQAEAEAAFLRVMQLDRSVLEGLGENAFPASIEVSLKEEGQQPDAMARLAARWTAFAGVDDVRYGERLIQDLSVAARVVSILGSGIGVALLGGVAVVIGVMVQISVRHRAQEVSLLRLFGASERVVVTPFVLEGMAIGFAGGVVASVVLAGGWWAAHRRWGTAFEGVFAGWIDRLEFPLVLVPGLIALAVLVGAVGSLAAVRRIPDAASSGVA